MNSILTIEQLTQNLDLVAPNKQAKVMKRIQIPASELEAFATWSNQSYTRNCLARTENYELILLCWDIGAKAPIHDHGGEDCWVYQVQGTVEEIRYQEEDNTLKETYRHTLTPNKLTYMHDRMGYHSIGNISNQRAMTLHIYAAPIDVCQVYNDQTDSFETKTMSYHTYKGQPETPALV